MSQNIFMLYLAVFKSSLRSKGHCWTSLICLFIKLRFYWCLYL